MRIFDRHIIIAAVAAIGSLATLCAQVPVTPYSMFGYGLLNDNATSAQRAMGGVGYAMRSGRQINVMNPASYAAIDSMTFLFDIGADISSLKSTENGIKSSNFTGGLDYVTLQVPLGKHMGASAGLLPLTSVGYSFGDEIANGTSARQGSGGINQVYLGFAGQPVKGLSLGFNVSYLFGSITHDTFAYTSTGSTALFESEMTVRDWRVQFGVQYGLTVAKRHTLTAGLSYTPGKTLCGDYVRWRHDVGTESAATKVSETGLRDNYALAESWGAGINYVWDNRLTAEFDFTYQPWSKANYGSGKNALADRYKYAIGFQYRHNQRGNYFQRIQFRIGGYLNRDYLLVDGDNVHETGISCGFGLPTPGGNKTIINLGFEYKHRQTHPTPRLAENYFNVTLGININEHWFMPNKLQ